VESGGWAMKGLWILTREVNDYNQHGSYFVAAFRNKPDPTDLIIAGVGPREVLHVLEGGGRIGTEDEWFILTEQVESTGYVDLIGDIKRVAEAFNMNVSERRGTGIHKKTTFLHVYGVGFDKKFEIKNSDSYTKMIIEDLVDDLQQTYFGENQ
jgi:hypothetical protein